jgi:hypothetical protein
MTLSYRHKYACFLLQQTFYDAQMMKIKMSQKIHH